MHLPPNLNPVERGQLLRHQSRTLMAGPMVREMMAMIEQGGDWVDESLVSDAVYALAQHAGCSQVQCYDVAEEAMRTANL